MTLCTLIVRCSVLIYDANGFSQVIKRSATGTVPRHFPVLPREGETLRLCRPQSVEYVPEFTVKNVTHVMGDKDVDGYEIDLGSAFLNDNDTFDKGIVRWEALGFTVTVKEYEDAS